MKAVIKASRCFFFLIIPTVTFCQKKITGVVSDVHGAPISLARVSVLNSASEHTFTDRKGEYELLFYEKDSVELEFFALGYVKQLINLNVEPQKSSYKLNVNLEEDLTELKEIIITPPIVQNKDTIAIKVDAYADGTEQNVEDLLSKIPGVSVDEEGTIRIGNVEIEKLMVGGDDLFDKGYRILSKNMPAYPLETVEILKNFSNNPLLKGIESGGKVALNLKIKEALKTVWFGNLDTGLGLNDFYEAKLNLMNLGKKNKFYFLTNLNSIGYDATGDIRSLINPFSGGQPASIGDDQFSYSLLSLSQSLPIIKRARTNFNNAELLSLNTIFNPTEKLKIKALGFFNWDETDFFRNGIDLTAVNGTSFTNTEEYQLENNKRIAFGKLDVTYNISKTKMLEATTKYNNGNFRDNSNLLFNGNSTIEKLQHQNTLFDQKIAYSNRFKDKKAFLLTGRFIAEKTPQNYTINQFFYQDLFPANSNANNVRQQSTNQMQFAGINAHLLGRKANGNLLELQLGNEFRKDRLQTTFSLLENTTVLEQPNAYQNATHYQVNDLYLKSKYRLKIKKLGIVGKLDVHQLFNQLENNASSSTQNPFFINPSLGFDWKINDKNKITSSYSYNTTNAKVLDVFSDFVLTGFRSFSKGTGSFNQLAESSFFINYQLGNWNDRFFANTFLVYSKNHDFFSTNTLLEQNFTQAEKIRIRDRTFLSVDSKLDYYFKFISSNLKIDLGYTKSEFKNIVNNTNLREVRSNNYQYGLEVRSGFGGFFNFHIGTKWSTTELLTATQNAFTNNNSFLDLSFIFNDAFDIQIQTERYFFGGLQRDNAYYFMDLDMRYKLIANKLTIGLSGKNLFNTAMFRTFEISDIGSSTTEYRLLPRFALLKLEYRF